MRYHNITHDDMLNGDGLRVVLWVAGCTHHCPQCQNPITWDIEGGIPFDEAAHEEIMQDLQKDYISGITFSGGDPLHPENRAEVAKLIAEIRANYPQKTIWLYTGYRWEEIKWLPFLDQIDVLIDGRFVQAQADPRLHWRGSANQRVIDVPRTLAANSIVLHDDK